MGGLERQERPRGGGSPRGHDQWKVVEVIIQNDYEIPGPEPGEHPLSVRRAVMEAPEVIA